MCGFCGYVNYKKDVTNKYNIEFMNNIIKHRGPNEQNVIIKDNIALGHVRLSIIDLKLGSQPMEKEHDGNKYVICYNGELYNTKEIKDDLIKKGYSFKTKCDTEVVLTAFIEYGTECLKNLNGIFSFCIYDYNKNSIFLARDHLGIKPLFYSLTKDGTLVFASEIKAILKHNEITPILDKEGFMELFALGPAHSPGKTYFKNIYELKAGHYAIFDTNGLFTDKFWDLETKECNDTEEEAISKIHFLLKDSLNRQLVSDVGISSMLSGGIDSSILTKLANDQIKDLTTFSIDFKGNDKNFVANAYQGSKDSDYIKIMREHLSTTNKDIKIDNEYLFTLLKDAMIARDMPGMADIDASMFAFCKAIKENGFKVCLSGECSDEIFGGYPWFYKEHLINHIGFPWALSENLRSNIIRPGILKDNEIQEYVLNARNETLKPVIAIDPNDTYENRYRNINYLTIKWFMNTLVERTDRTSMANSLEVRVPFADYRIFEYVYNLPAKMKLGLNHSDTPIEKYLLREAFKNDIPREVLYRKKSPFPKTYDPHYLNLVETEMLNILNNKKSKINNFINIDFIKDLIYSHGESLKENWFGQLMTYPQTLAYLIQINMWLETYNIESEI